MPTLTTYLQTLRQKTAPQKTVQATLRTGVVLAAALVLAACTATFRSDVTAFHDLPGNLTQKSVAISPMNPDNADSLEYAQYAAAIAEEMQARGFTIATSDAPDLVVMFDVGISEGREKVRATGGGWGAFGPWGVGFGGWGGPWGWGGFGPYGGWGGAGCFRCFGGFGRWGGWGAGLNSNVYVRTVYPSILRVEIREPDGKMIFEARAQSELRKNNLPEAVPFLARTILADFPGENGVTRKVRVEKYPEDDA